MVNNLYSPADQRKVRIQPSERKTIMIDAAFVKIDLRIFSLRIKKGGVGDYMLRLMSRHLLHREPLGSYYGYEARPLRRSALFSNHMTLWEMTRLNGLQRPHR